MTEKQEDEFPFCLILDSNIWVSERLLQTTIGSALLFAVSAGQASIVLPEIVELEVEGVLLQLADKAVENIRKGIGLLKHLSGHNLMSLMAPNRTALETGIRKRLTELGGVIRRVEFTHSHAKSALMRILAKTPPCGDNNEQFRDCCIWEVTLETARCGPVHIITNDTAFYNNRNRSSGLASKLVEEINGNGIRICVHSSIQEFLSDKKASIAALDRAVIAEKIMAGAIKVAKDIVTTENENGRNSFELGAPSPPRIQGFATPMPTIFAVSFQIKFDMKNLAAERGDATLTLQGTCSYDPSQNSVSEVEVQERSISLKGTMGGMSWHTGGSWKEIYSNVRLIG